MSKFDKIVENYTDRYTNLNRDRFKYNSKDLMVKLAGYKFATLDEINEIKELDFENTS